MINRTSPKPFPAFLSPSIYVIFLSILIWTIYGKVGHFDFIQFDDQSYVCKNEWIREGFSWAGIKWAFTAFACGNWHPLTWISHMLDCEFFGLNPGPHHLTNVMFHHLTSLLVFTFFFLVLRYQQKNFKNKTDHLWLSIFISFLFAFHPQRVESVAWIAERKDVLSGFFWMSTLLSYYFYCRKTSVLRYLLVIGFFTMGLLSKPMVVTLPCVLLLLDYWPLSRFTFTKNDLPKVYECLKEKIPLFILVFISCALTFLAQSKGGAVVATKYLPVYLRISNATFSYIRYIGKFLYPKDLSIFYPYQDMKQVSFYLGLSAVLIFGITFFSLKKIKKYPWLFTGWFWYLGTMIPVIGIVQVGSQSMADRYTYLPFIGIYWILAISMKNTWERFVRLPIRFFWIASMLILSLFSLRTFFQLDCWKNTFTLFEHSLRVTSNNHLAHTILARTYTDEENFKEALKHYLKASEIFSRAENDYNVGTTYLKLGRLNESLTYLIRTIEKDPTYQDAYNNLSIVYIRLKMFKEAIPYLHKWLEYHPEDMDAHLNLGASFFQLKQYDKALNSLKEILKFDPQNEKALFLLTQVHILLDDRGSASAIHDKLKNLNPSLAAKISIPDTK